MPDLYLLNGHLKLTLSDHELETKVNRLFMLLAELGSELTSPSLEILLDSKQIYPVLNKAFITLVDMEDASLGNFMYTSESYVSKTGENVQHKSKRSSINLYRNRFTPKP